MRAIIMAGGKGTRLRPYTTTLPKPLMPVGEEPILRILLKQLVSCGFGHITISVGHMAEVIMATFGDHYKAATIDYIQEDQPLGTIGALKLIKDLPKDFLVVNGDTLTDINFAAVYNAHIYPGQETRDLTIATVKRSHTIDFGVLTVRDNDKAINFEEKPHSRYTVAMGVNILSRELVAMLPYGPYGFDQMVWLLLHKHLPVYTYPYDGFWLDIGRPEDYDKANELAAQGTLPI